MVSKPDSSIKMFEQVLNKLCKMKWRINGEAHTILVQYKKFVSEVNFMMKEFAGLKFAEDRLDSFLFEAVEYKLGNNDLYSTHGISPKIVVRLGCNRNGFLVNKEVVAPNL